MAETTNISRMAEILSKDLFSGFLWQQSGPTNTNWNCEATEQHKAKTHPTDVVFWYDNPYSQSRTYVNCDLKSYASGSITAGAIISSMESLARTVACANVSEEWQKRFVHEHVHHEICGLLFVYNHDGQYDKNFKQVIATENPRLDELPRKSKIVLLGPEDIFWLNNIRYEIIQLRGKGIIPEPSACKFFYPHLTRRKNVQLAVARAATLEMLTSPWVILSYERLGKTHQKGYVIFYRPRGDSIKEFLYLLDYLMHYQVIVEDFEVRILTLQADSAASAIFAKAVDEYVDACDGSQDIKKRLDAIVFNQMREIRVHFSEIEIGMGNV